MNSTLARLESLLGKMEKAVAPSRTCEERLDDAVARMEKLFAAGSNVVSNPHTAAKLIGKPKVELQSRGTGKDRKWVVEYQVGKKDLVIKADNPKQTVYILGCIDSTIQIQGQVNSVILDKCTKTSVFVKDAVHSAEVLGCNSVELELKGATSSVVIDHTMGCIAYLGQSAREEVEITTSRSSGVNVQALGASEDEDSIEHAVPEQFVTTFKDGKFETVPAPV